MPDRLDYIKQKLEEQKKSPAVILRHSDGEWAVSEIERLRAENDRLHELMSEICKAQLRSSSSYVLARVEEIANEYKREFKQ
ncbi:hypothetical protein [Sporolactobacillus laevolacticus]|uniref:Uncharacterized protein n=1 Tax=Sporolactobacillus laevolacticus DSM 442 TaxID=1395513 RepID=V6IVU9_9BACL|nr:hypothetical protein [Sporolactobacillus laevolacticus]EST11270.1 hypothetical protein P343_12745 [Sporolactobacillus laevolacticus DSM 442]